MAKYKYTKWAEVATDMDVDHIDITQADYVWLLGPEPKEFMGMKNPYTLTEEGELCRYTHFIPILSEKGAWHRNIAQLKWAMSIGIIDGGFFDYIPHLFLLKKCLKGHYKAAVKQLEKEFGIEIPRVNFTPPKRKVAKRPDRRVRRRV